LIDPELIAPVQKHRPSFYVEKQFTAKHISPMLAMFSAIT